MRKTYFVWVGGILDYETHSIENARMAFDHLVENGYDDAVIVDESENIISRFNNFIQ